MPCCSPPSASPHINPWSRLYPCPTGNAEIVTDIGFPCQGHIKHIVKNAHRELLNKCNGNEVSIVFPQIPGSASPGQTSGPVCLPFLPILSLSRVWFSPWRIFSWVLHYLPLLPSLSPSASSLSSLCMASSESRERRLPQVSWGADGNGMLETKQEEEPSQGQLGFTRGVLVLEMWVSPLVERCRSQRRREWSRNWSSGHNFFHWVLAKGLNPEHLSSFSLSPLFLSFLCPLSLTVHFTKQKGKSKPSNLKTQMSAFHDLLYHSICFFSLNKMLKGFTPSRNWPTCLSKPMKNNHQRFRICHVFGSK